MSVEELFVILTTPKPSEVLKQREEDLFNLIPELRACKGFDQENEMYIYDVLEHIYHVIDNTPRRLELRLAALFHDCEKPKAFYKDEKGVGYFKEHWAYAKKTFEKFAKEHDLDQRLAAYVAKLILYHDIDLDILDKKGYNSMNQIFTYDEFEDLLDMKKADLMAQNPKYHYLENNLIQNENDFLDTMRGMKGRN